MDNINHIHRIFFWEIFLLKMFKSLLNIECIYEYILDYLLINLYVSNSIRYGNTVYKKSSNTVKYLYYRR